MTVNSSSVKAKTPQKYLFDAEFDYSETIEDIQSITPKKHQLDIGEAKKKPIKKVMTTALR